MTDEERLEYNRYKRIVYQNLTVEQKERRNKNYRDRYARIKKKNAPLKMNLITESNLTLANILMLGKNSNI